MGGGQAFVQLPALDWEKTWHLWLGGWGMVGCGRMETGTAGMVLEILHAWEGLDRKEWHGRTLHGQDMAGQNSNGRLCGLPKALQHCTF